MTPRHECLQSFHADTIAQHDEQRERRQVIGNEEPQSQPRDRQQREHGGVNEQVTDLFQPCQRCLSHNGKRIRRQQRPGHTSQQCETTRAIQEQRHRADCATSDNRFQRNAQCKGFMSPASRGTCQPVRWFRSVELLKSLIVSKC